MRACINAIKRIFVRICSFRYITIFIMFFFIIDMFIRPLRRYAQSAGEVTNISMLAMMFCSNYFLKMIMLSVIYFYSNVPFIERPQQYYFLRLGRTRFCCHNLIYIIISSIVLSISLWGISIMDMIKCISFDNKWDRLSRTLALTDAGNSIGLHFYVPYPPIERFLPFQLCSYTFLITVLCISLIGMLMYAMCMMFHKATAILVAGVVVMFPDIIKGLNSHLSLIYWSPVSWMGCDTWRYGYEISNPDLEYIIICYLFLIFLFGAVCLFISKKMEFTE